MPSRAAMIAPATSPSEMNLIRAPAALTSSASVSCRGRSRMQTVRSATFSPLARAMAFRFVRIGALMSMTSAESGPTTSFSM